ncbi:hypothetical protein BCV69DRAFT_118793 [Microstroma glucosiphilum]|uniref:Uncharacterized protein n=1 Tax=Pseudomicrostroma glucosiphilum TaxID=1684307 RepID=A0A316UDX9_9BASI|nr:hypothetical protein BCV69DRAFT_118793 [Pseudomicrostroma glucosiphilum]PWN23419.1 hypothetical protein BCV69DRAFT_118793 [Pseudomicrostroma glucosiphilum]
MEMCCLCSASAREAGLAQAQMREHHCRYRNTAAATQATDNNNSRRQHQQPSSLPQTLSSSYTNSSSSSLPFLCYCTISGAPKQLLPLLLTSELHVTSLSPAPPVC